MTQCAVANCINPGVILWNLDDEDVFICKHHAWEYGDDEAREELASDGYVDD